MNPIVLVSLILISVSAASLFIELTQSNEALALTEIDADQKASPIPLLRVANQDISALMNQPVFSETRQPLTRLQNTPVISNKRDVVYELSGQYRLAGLVLTEEQALAVVLDQKSAETQKLAINDKIDGWYLKNVEPTFAIFEKAQQERRLALWRQQENKPSQAPVAESTPPELIRIDASDGVFEEDPYQ